MYCCILITLDNTLYTINYTLYTPHYTTLTTLYCILITLYQLYYCYTLDTTLYNTTLRCGIPSTLYNYKYCILFTLYNYMYCILITLYNCKYCILITLRLYSQRNEILTQKTHLKNTMRTKGDFYYFKLFFLDLRNLFSQTRAVVKQKKRALFLLLYHLYYCNTLDTTLNSTV